MAISELNRARGAKDTDSAPRRTRGGAGMRKGHGVRKSLITTNFSTRA